MIDTHCHLDFPDFNDDRDIVVKRAKEAGIEYIVNVGASLESSRASLDLARKYEFIYCAVGVHPHEADAVNARIKSGIEALSRQDKVVAIGETGLDYYRNYSGHDNQKALFIWLIELGKKRGFPLVIHNRQADEQVLNILREHQVSKGVVHCFSGSEDFLKGCLDLGLFISFTCNITYKKAENLRRLIELIPVERIMLETDAPYLSPDGFRGRRNEPVNVKYAALEIAKLKGLSLEEAGKITTDNARRFFNF